MSLMAELGEGPPPPKQESPRPTYTSPPPQPVVGFITSMKRTSLHHLKHEDISSE